MLSNGRTSAPSEVVHNQHGFKRGAGLLPSKSTDIVARTNDVMNVEGADDLGEAGDCGDVEVAPADPAKKNLESKRRWKGEGTEGKE